MNATAEISFRTALRDDACQPLAERHAERRDRPSSARLPPMKTGQGELDSLAMLRAASCVLSPSSAMKSRPKVEVNACQLSRRARSGIALDLFAGRSLQLAHLAQRADQDDYAHDDEGGAGDALHPDRRHQRAEQPAKGDAQPGHGREGQRSSQEDRPRPAKLAGLGDDRQLCLVAQLGDERQAEGREQRVARSMNYPFEASDSHAPAQAGANQVQRRGDEEGRLNAQALHDRRADEGRRRRRRYWQRRR